MAATKAAIFLFDITKLKTETTTYYLTIVNCAALLYAPLLICNM